MTAIDLVLHKPELRYMYIVLRYFDTSNYDSVHVYIILRYGLLDKYLAIHVNDFIRSKLE
jgi:hypothetical protein